MPVGRTTRARISKVFDMGERWLELRSLVRTIRIRRIIQNAVHEAAALSSSGEYQSNPTMEYEKGKMWDARVAPSSFIHNLRNVFHPPPPPPFHSSQIFQDDISPRGKSLWIIALFAIFFSSRLASLWEVFKPARMRCINTRTIFLKFFTLLECAFSFLIL